MGIRTELKLRLPNSPGALAGICRLLAEERVTMIGVSLESGGHVRLVVDNPVRASGALRSHHHQVTEHDVLFVNIARSPDGLAPVLALVADAGVNVNYAYSAAAETPAGAAVVLGVDDVQRASAATGL
jgi:hypothetical protein